MDYPAPSSRVAGRFPAGTRADEMCRYPSGLESWRTIETLAGRHPELLSSATRAGPQVQETLLTAARHPGVFLEFSSHRPRHMARARSGWAPLLHHSRGLARDRVLFGTSTWGNPVLVGDLADECPRCLCPGGHHGMALHQRCGNAGPQRRGRRAVRADDRRTHGLSRRRPARLHSDKVYDHLLCWLRGRGITHRSVPARASSPPPGWDAAAGPSAAEGPPAPPAPPLRAQGRTLPRLRRHSRSPHLLPPTRHMRSAPTRSP